MQENASAGWAAHRSPFSVRRPPFPFWSLTSECCMSMDARLKPSEDPPPGLPQQRASPPGDGPAAAAGQGVRKVALYPCGTHAPGMVHDPCQHSTTVVLCCRCAGCAQNVWSCGRPPIRVYRRPPHRQLRRRLVGAFAPCGGLLGLLLVLWALLSGTVWDLVSVVAVMVAVTVGVLLVRGGWSGSV